MICSNSIPDQLGFAEQVVDVPRHDRFVPEGQPENSPYGEVPITGIFMMSLRDTEVSPNPGWMDRDLLIPVAR